MEIDIIKLENNQEYDIIDTIVNKNSNYVFLSNHEKNEDICVRKVITKDGKDYLIRLDNSEEFDEIMNLFYEKYKGEEK